MIQPDTKELEQLCHNFSALTEPNKQVVVDISRVLLGSQKNRLPVKKQDISVKRRKV
jgi:hypothetical protein